MPFEQDTALFEALLGEDPSAEDFACLCLTTKITTTTTMMMTNAPIAVDTKESARQYGSSARTPPAHAGRSAERHSSSPSTKRVYPSTASRQSPKVLLWLEGSRVPFLIRSVTNLGAVAERASRLETQPVEFLTAHLLVRPRQRPLDQCLLILLPRSSTPGPSRYILFTFRVPFFRRRCWRVSRSCIVV